MPTALEAAKGVPTTEPYDIPQTDFSQKALQAAQIHLLQAQSRKTQAETINTELQENYNRVVSDLYGSFAGTPLAASNAVGKAAGTVASGFGLFKAGQAINRLRKRKSKVIPKSKSLTNLQKQKLRKLHELKTKSPNKFGLRPGEYIDKRTGEIRVRGKSSGKSGGGFSLRRGFGNRSGRYNKFNKF